MGRKQNRKRARRQRARSDFFELLAPTDANGWAPPSEVESIESDDAILALFGHRGAGAARSCGTCREFIEDGEFGRGTCLHPGSGVLSPWENTPGCEFYAGRRRQH